MGRIDVSAIGLIEQDQSHFGIKLRWWPTPGREGGYHDNGYPHEEKWWYFDNDQEYHTVLRFLTVVGDREDLGDPRVLTTSTLLAIASL